MAASSSIWEDEMDEPDNSDESQSHPSVIIIDPNGNVQLSFGPNYPEFLVDSNALRRSSKVFERLLSDCDSAGGWTVHLGDIANPQSFKHILDAAHANFGQIPKVLSLSQLHDVASLAAKFEMVKVLQPWAGGWTSKWKLPKLLAVGPEKPTIYSDILRISFLYQLGTPESFSQHLVDVLLNTKTDSDGDLVFSSNGEQHGKDGRTCPQDVRWSRSGADLPDALLVLAGEIRRKAIRPLLKSVNDMFRACTSELSKYNLHQICGAVALGEMIQCLVDHGLWPVPSEQEFRLSAWELSRIASSVEKDACKCRLVRDPTAATARLACIFHILVQMDCEMQVDLREEVMSTTAAHFDEIGAETAGRQKMKLRESL